MLLRFTVKAIYVSSSTSVWICMNEWNHIPIVWLSDTSPKAQGQELVASRWTGRLIVPLYLRAGWMIWIANPCRCLLRSSSILLKCPIDLATFCWQNESECMNLITDDLFLFTYHLCTFNREFFGMKSPQNITSFMKYSRAIGMHIH